jgi:hypothetical protein
MARACKAYRFNGIAAQQWRSQQIISRMHHQRVRATCDIDKLGLRRLLYEPIFHPRYECLSETRRTCGPALGHYQCALSSPAAAVAWKAWHFRHRLVNIPPCNPETGAAKPSASGAPARLRAAPIGPQRSHACEIFCHPTPQRLPHTELERGTVNLMSCGASMTLAYSLWC